MSAALFYSYAAITAPTLSAVKFAAMPRFFPELVV
jgi:hypothetical protein